MSSRVERRYARIRLGSESAISADTWLYERGTERTFNARITVLGLGGLFLEMGSSSSQGSLVSLSFNLPAQRSPILCSGIVRDGLPGRGVGLEFLEMASSDRARLGTFINQSRHG
jgi:hypothetical protein